MITCRGWLLYNMLFILQNATNSCSPVATAVRVCSTLGSATVKLTAPTTVTNHRTNAVRSVPLFPILYPDRDCRLLCFKLSSLLSRFLPICSFLLFWCDVMCNWRSCFCAIAIETHVCEAYEFSCDSNKQGATPPYCISELQVGSSTAKTLSLHLCSRVKPVVCKGVRWYWKLCERRGRGWRLRRGSHVWSVPVAVRRWNVYLERLAMWSRSRLSQSWRRTRLWWGFPFPSPFPFLLPVPGWPNDCNVLQSTRSARMSSSNATTRSAYHLLSSATDSGTVATEQMRSASTAKLFAVRQKSMKNLPLEHFSFFKIRQSLATKRLTSSAQVACVFPRVKFATTTTTVRIAKTKKRTFAVIFLQLV